MPFFIFVAFFLFKNYDEEDFEFENKLIGNEVKKLKELRKEASATSAESFFGMQ